MKRKLPTKAILVALLIAVAIPSVSEARRFGFFRWWQAAAVEPVPDGTVFPDTEVDNSNLYCLTIGGRPFFQLDNIEFEPTTTNTGVAEGEFRTRPYLLSNGGTVQAQVTLEYADLNQGPKANFFRAPGELIYFDPDTDTRESLDVMIVGRIKETDEGTYVLKAKVIGLDFSFNGVLDVKLFTQCLNGESGLEIPDDLDPPIDRDPPIDQDTTLTR